MGWNRAKIAVWGEKQEAARHCRVAPSRRLVNMAICTNIGPPVGYFLCILLNFIFGTLHKISSWTVESLCILLNFIFSVSHKKKTTYKVIFVHFHENNFRHYHENGRPVRAPFV